MKKIFIRILIIFCFLLISRINYAQDNNLPDYSERSFLVIPDSLANEQSNLMSQFPMEATEGSVDPDEYIVGPGDKILVSINGIEDINLTLAINQEGYFFVPKVGGIDLRNKTLTEAKKLIRDAIFKYYKNVDIFISLINFRKIKVSLLGDVKKPSTFVLSANSRLIDLIVNSMGLTETSNYRNIKIITNDKDTSTYDFLSFLRFGNKKDNPLLREGSVVIVDKVDKVVSIYGEIKYNGIYEFVPGETVYHLIQLAGGLTSKARVDSIEVVSFEKNGKFLTSSYYSLNKLKTEHLILKKQDKVLIRQIPEYYIDRYVRITGYVNYPGYYKIRQNQTTLSEVIKEAGGFRKEASLSQATLTRFVGTEDIDPEYERLKTMERKDMSDDEYDYLKAKSRQRKGRVVVDFVDLFVKHNLDEDVILKMGDIVSVPEAKDYIIMLGQVVNPGNVIYQPGLRVDDYIKLAGGFGWRAESGDVRVIKAQTGEWIDAGDVDSLKPGDTIWVPEEPPGPKFWDVFTSSLQVLGQVAAIIAATVAVIVATR